MKSWFAKGLITAIILLSLGMKSVVVDEVELICMRKQHSTKTCHYNFMIRGIPYRYIDHGCKEKMETLIKKAKDGKLALAKEWKLDCPQLNESAHRSD